MSDSCCEPRPLVSIVIPCFNQGRYLRESVKSAQRQSHRPIEIIVVDDGSTLSEDLRLFENWPHPGVRLHRQENRGLSGARNAGAAVSQGDFLVFLDADDRLRPQFIERTLALMQSDERLGWVGCGVHNFGAMNRDFLRPIDPQELLFANPYVATCLLRRTAYEQADGFKHLGAGYEDWDFWLTLRELGWRDAMVQEVLFEYRRHFRSSMLDDAKEENDRLCAMIVRRHRALYENNLESMLGALIRHHQSPPDFIGQFLDDTVFHWQRKAVVMAANSAKTLIPRRPEVRPSCQTRKRPLAGAKAKADTPVVSVVITNYNQSRYLRESITSVKEQSYKQLDLIVVDDGSTLAMDRSLFDNWPFPDIRLHRQTNQGVSTARNRGAARAQGDFLLFLDADDRLRPEFIERTLDLIQTDDHLGWVGTGVRFFGAMNRDCLHDIDPLELLFANPYTVSCLMRKAAYEQAGGFKALQAGLEDWDFWLTLRELGWRDAMVPEILFEYRKHFSASRTDHANEEADALASLLVNTHRALYENNLEAMLGAIMRYHQDRNGRIMRLLDDTVFSWQRKAIIETILVAKKLVPKSLKHSLRRKLGGAP